MTTEEARKKIEKAGFDWQDFVDWMAGQTVGMYPDGSTDWYEYDVERFIGGKDNFD